MLKTSLFNKGIYKSQLSRFKWGSLLYFILLFFTSSFILLINDFSYVSDYTLQMYEKAGGIILTEDFMIITILLATVVPTVTAFLSFDMFSSKRQSVFIHSLPCGRNAIYISTLLGAFTLMFIPVVANGLILMLISIFKLSAYYPVAACFKWIIINIVMLFIMFSISVFSANITSNRVSMVLINALLHVIPLIVAFGVGSVASVYLYGFDDNFNSLIDNTVQWMPITFAWVWNGDNYCRFVENLISYKSLIFALGALMVYSVCLILYKNRNNESAGNFVAYKIMNPIFKYTVTAISVITTFSVINFRGFYMALLLVVISSVVYFASEMVLKKNLKIFKNYKGYLVFALICILINGFFQYTSFFGYEKRVPELENIKGVAVYENNHNGYEKPYTEDINVIETALKYHKDLISDIPDIIDRNSGNYNRIYIEYSLKNGKTLKRTYIDLSVEERMSVFSGLFEHKEYRLASDYVHKLDLGKVEFLRISFDVTNSYNINFGIEGKENIKKFIDSWKKDIENLGYMEKTENIIMNLSADYERDVVNYREDVYVYVHEGFNGNFKNVMNYLEKNGYLDVVYNLENQKVYISKTPHLIETKQVENITKQFFDGEEYNTYALGKNQVELISTEDARLMVKDILNGGIRKEFKNGENYLIFVAPDETQGFQRNTWFLSLDKENLPEYLKKYIQ